MYKIVNIQLFNPRRGYRWEANLDDFVSMISESTTAELFEQIGWFLSDPVHQESNRQIAKYSSQDNCAGGESNEDGNIRDPKCHPVKRYCSSIYYSIKTHKESSQCYD